MIVIMNVDNEIGDNNL